MRLSGPMSQRWDERIQKRTPGVDTRWRGLSLGDKHLMHGTESPKKRTPPISLLLAYAAVLTIAEGRPVVDGRWIGHKGEAPRWPGSLLGLQRRPNCWPRPVGFGHPSNRCGFRVDGWARTLVPPMDRQQRD